MSGQTVSDYQTNLQTRNATEKYFITFPQWDCSDSDIRQSILQYFPPHKFGISCVETHEDGGKHIHCIIALETRRTPAQFRQWVLSQFSDEDANKIHIGSVRALKQAIEYINKEDTDVYTVGIVPKYNSCKKGLTKKQIEQKMFEEECENKRYWDNYMESVRREERISMSHWYREQYRQWVKCEARCNFYDLVDNNMIEDD